MLILIYDHLNCALFHSIHVNCMSRQYQTYKECRYLVLCKRPEQLHGDDDKSESSLQVLNGETLWLLSWLVKQM